MSPARRYAAALRSGHPASWLSLLVVFALGAAGAWAWHASRGRERTDDAFVEGTLGRLAAEVPGRVVAILVDEHEPVEAGALLLRLDPAQARVRLERARADLLAARNRMREAEAAAAAYEAEARAAQVESWRASREFERVQGLAARGAASPQQVDAARAARDAALARVQALEGRARATRSLLGDEAPVRQAQAAVRDAELALARTELHAPYAAVIGRRNVNVGDIVRAGQPLMALRRREPFWVMANFKETQLRRMHAGAPARIHVDAFPDYTWWGHVESFSPASGAKYALIPPEPASGNFTKVVQRVPVKIVIDSVSNGAERLALAEATQLPDLAVGLSAQVEVDVR